MRDLLKSLTQLSEGETKDTKTGRVHKGSYGTSYEAGDEGVKKQETQRGRGRPKKDADETGEVKKYDSSALSAAMGGGKKPSKEVGKVSAKHSIKEGETTEKKGGRVHKGSYGSEYETDKEGNEVKKASSDVKKGRGRPKKAGGEESKFDSSALNNVFGGKKPKKEVGKVSAKNSLKEYMESVEDTKNAEAIMEGMFGGVDHSSVAANLGKLARVIKSVQTPEQFAVAQKYAQRMSGTIQQHQHAGMGFGPGLRANIQVSRAIQDDLKRKAAELGIEYKALEEAGVSVKPMPGASQIVSPDGKPIGTADAQTAQVIKTAADQGKLQFGGQQEMEEGKKAKPDFLDVDKDKNKKEPFKKAVADKKKVAEGRDLTASEYLDEKVAKILAREKPGMDTVKSNDAFYAAIYNELIQCGLTPKAARHKVSYDEDFISDVASAYQHYQNNPTLDEGTADDYAMRGMTPDSVFTKPGSPMAVPRTQAPVGGAAPAAPASPAAKFVSSLRNNTTLEGKDMKDMQVESWEKQLKGLLTEGLTVSSSTGQQGQPNTLTVSATEGDADELMSVLRNAGIGGFGAEQGAPEIGYGVAQGGEEEFNGTGTQPQPSPDVVGDDGDMLSMLKKMAGLGGGDAEVVAIDTDGEEGGQDYEDEEGSDDTALQPADGDEEQDSEEDDTEETDEGNAFTGKLKQTPQGGSFKQGGKSYKDTSSIEEGGFDPEQFGSDGAGAGGGDEEESVEEGLLGTAGGGAVGAALGGPVGAALGAVAGDAIGDMVSGDKKETNEGEHTCEDCGMNESECECDHEKVEENFANSAQDPAEQELLKLKALLSMGNDMHKIKHSQATGNIQKVTMEGMLNDWKKLSGIK